MAKNVTPKADWLRQMREQKAAAVEKAIAATQRAGVKVHASVTLAKAADAQVASLMTLGDQKAKRGRPKIEDKDKTLAATKPWIELGISRATWMRRQKDKKP